MLHSMLENVASFQEEEPHDLFEDRGNLAALDDSQHCIRPLFLKNEPKSTLI